MKACVLYQKEKCVILFIKEIKSLKRKKYDRNNTIFQVYLLKSEMRSWIEIVQKSGDFLGATLDKPQK